MGARGSVSQETGPRVPACPADQSHSHGGVFCSSRNVCAALRATVAGAGCVIAPQPRTAAPPLGPAAAPSTATTPPVAESRSSRGERARHTLRPRGPLASRVAQPPCAMEVDAPGSGGGGSEGVPPAPPPAPEPAPEQRAPAPEPHPASASAAAASGGEGAAGGPMIDPTPVEATAPGGEPAPAPAPAPPSAPSSPPAGPVAYRSRIYHLIDDGSWKDLATGFTTAERRALPAAAAAGGEGGQEDEEEWYITVREHAAPASTVLLEVPLSAGYVYKLQQGACWGGRGGGGGWGSVAGLGLGLSWAGQGWGGWGLGPRGART